MSALTVQLQNLASKARQVKVLADAGKAQCSLDRARSAASLAVFEDAIKSARKAAASGRI